MCSDAQLCLARCDPVDFNSPGSSVHGDFPREEYWSGLPFPFPGNLPKPEMESHSLTPPTLASRSLVPPVKPLSLLYGKMSTLAFPLLLVRSKALKPYCFLCNFRPCCLQSSKLLWRLHTEKKKIQGASACFSGLWGELLLGLKSIMKHYVLISSNEKLQFIRLPLKLLSNLFIKVHRLMASYTSLQVYITFVSTISHMQTHFAEPSPGLP